MFRDIFPINFRLIQLCNLLCIKVIDNFSISLQNQMQKQQSAKQEIIQDGFSSQEQVRHEQVELQQEKIQAKQNTHKQQVKFKIPPPQQIKSKSYSLNPDIATGWAPKNDLPVPIPLIFDHKRTDNIIKKLLQKSKDKMKLCYLGPRFENTFYAWHDKQFKFPYSHIRTPTSMKFSNRAFSGQNPQCMQGLIFNSFFDSGNLDCAVQVGQREYDLYIRVDSNTRGHLQWFNFKVKNLQKLQKYKFNICNFQKHRSLYSRGMKPYIFSVKKYEKTEVMWQQGGQCIKYEQKLGKSGKILNLEFSTSYKMSFQYYTQFEQDEVQIAYCIPYTYTDLNNLLKNIQKQSAGKQFLTINKLCTSLGGLDVPLLIIHQNPQKPLKKQSQTQISKKCIMISGRAHPGQSNGSYMMEGFLRYICSDSASAKKLRTDFIFKVVPMLNPDGVTLGNYRTGISGRDFNRQYRNPDKLIFPEVYSFKKLVSQNKAIYRQNLLMFLDFHGHSTKKNVFMYGPQFPIIQKHYYECRIFPKMLGNTTKMFRYYSCAFKVSEFKQTTARAVFLRKLMIPFSYTIQASNGSYYDHEKLKDVLFSASTWINMGRNIGQTLCQYCDMVVGSQKNRVQKQRQRKAKRQIHIRKSSRNKNKESQNNIANVNNEIQILSTDNQKVKKLFEEIKKAEEQKQVQKNEEDEISEGSSDGQGEKDDLSPQKLNFLFQVIKNKRLNINQKHLKKLEQEQDDAHFKTNQAQQKDNCVYQINNQNNHEAAYQQDFIDKQDIIFKPNANLRGYLLRNKNSPANYFGQQKKQKTAAKIINFSFIGHSKSAVQAESRRGSLKNQYFQTNSISNRLPNKNISNTFELKDSSKNNNRVLDLSDNSFRQTYGNSNFKSSEPKPYNDKYNDKKATTFYNTSPRKLLNRIDDYKYKRLLINQYKI